MTDLPPPSRITFGDTQIRTVLVTQSALNVATNTVTIVSSRVVTIPTADAEQRFRELAEEWYVDTLVSSSYYDKILHPAYQKILRLDIAAVPLILRELEAMPNDWFWALRIITEVDPVRPEQAGDMQAMADSWLAWGRDEGYI